VSGAHVRDEIDACLDGGLSAARRQAVLAHAAGCGECGVALERATRLHRALGDVPVPDPGARYWIEFTARVEARIARPAIVHGAARGLASFYERLLGWLVRPTRFGWVGVAATVAVATLIVYVGLRGFQPRDAHVAMRATAPAPQPAPEISAPSVPVVPRADAPASSAPLARNVRPPVPSARAGHHQPATTQSAELHAIVEAKASDELHAMGKAKAVMVNEQTAAQAGAPAIERPDVAQVTMPEKDSRNDPVADFVRAAIAGDSTTVRATYAALAAGDFAGVAPDDAERLRSWAAASGPQAAGALQTSFPGHNKLKEVFRAAPPPVSGPPAAPAASALAAPRSESTPWPAFDAKGLDAQRVEPLLALEALAWPRRTDPALRPTLAALAERLAPLAPNDARAAERAAALAVWLEDTSSSSQERGRWDTLRQDIPRR